MPKLVSIGVAAWLTLMACQTEALAQQLEELPAALPQTASKQSLDRQEALKIYGRGLMFESDNRLLEALKSFEQAAQLDGESVVINKALIALYLALDRGSDALATCSKTVKFAPEVVELWYLSGRLQRTQGQNKEAAASFLRALDSPALKHKPELLVQVAGDLGDLCEEQGKFEQALDAYDLVAAALENPDALIETGVLSREELVLRAASLQEHIGQLCLKNKQFDRAAAAFVKAQEKDPQMANRLDLHLARVRLAQKKAPEALKHLDSYLKAQPQGTEAYELKIEVLESLGRKDEVLPALKDYAERDAHNLALQLLVAGRLTQEKKYGEAETCFLTVLGESPTPEGYRGLFLLYQADGKMDKVIDMLDQTLAKARGNDKTPADAAAGLRARAMLGVLRDNQELVKSLLVAAEAELGRRNRSRETWQFLAALAGHAKQLPAAEKLFLHCMKLMQGLEQRQRNEFEHELYSGLLEAQFKLKKYDDVIVWARKGLKECEAVHRLLLHDFLFRAQAQQGKYDAALVELDEAIKAAGPEHQLYFRRTRTTLLSMAGLHDKAADECLKLLDKATKADEIRDIRYTLSGIYTAAKKHALAEAQLRAILEADAADDVASNDLGYIMADQNKNLDEAEKLIRRALELDRAQRSDKADKNKTKVDAEADQDRASYVDSLGWVLFRKGQIDDARKELERAVALPGGDDPVLWDHLGDVYLRANQPDKARNAFQKAVELYDTDRRRQRDDQFRELQRKLKLLK